MAPRPAALLLHGCWLAGLVGLAGAQQSPNSCRRHIPPELWAVVWPERHSLPVVLYGVAGTPSTVAAQRRLEAAGVCYTARLSATADEALIAYMRCEVPPARSSLSRHPPYHRSTRFPSATP